MGTRSVTATIRATLAMSVNNLLSDGEKTPTVDLGAALTTALTSGTGAAQCDRGWSEYERDLASGANEALDLFDFAGRDIGAGAGNDALGQAMALAEVVCFVVYNAGPGSLTVAPDATNGWSQIGTEVIKAGGYKLLFAPTDPAYTVVDASSHRVNFAAASGDCTYDVHIAGRSA